MTAGLLHDVLESSDTTAVELRVRFGPVIASLVERHDSFYALFERAGANVEQATGLLAKLITSGRRRYARTL